MNSRKLCLAIIAVSDVIRAGACNRLDTAAVNYYCTAVSAGTAADTCSFVAAYCRNSAAVNCNSAAAAEETAADTCGIKTADSNYSAAVYSYRSAFSRRASADTCAVTVGAARCIYCSRIDSQCSV